MLRPLTRICPAVGGSARNSSFKKVDLPAPDGRSGKRTPPGRSSRSRPPGRAETGRTPWRPGRAGSRGAARQSALERVPNFSRVGAPRRLLHDLTDEPAERLGLAGPVERDLRGAAGEDLGDRLLHGARIAKAAEPLSGHDVRGAGLRSDHLPENLFGGSDGDLSLLE